MGYILIGKAIGKAEVEFIGVLEGKEITHLLLTNKCVEVGKSYAVNFDDYEVVGTAMVIEADDVIEVQETYNVAL